MASMIQQVFNKKKPFIAYITAGDPSLKKTKKMIYAFAKTGVDIIELGLPFSDPLADGAVIEASHQRALKKKVNLTDIITLVKEVRRDLDIPIIFMGALNLFLAYGLKQFFSDASNVGVDGIIVPDLPPEESKDFLILSKHFSLDIIFLASTITPEERLKNIASVSNAFIYLISSKGVTGARAELPMDDISQTIDVLRKYTTVPIAIGFGVSTPQQALAIFEVADGVIVGSAIVKNIEKSVKRGINFVKKFVNKMERK